MSHSDTKSITITATGSVRALPTRIRSIYFHSGASDGSIILKNGGASGTTLIELSTAPAINFSTDASGSGVRFTSDVHATLTNITSCTIFYEG